MAVKNPLVITITGSAMSGKTTAAHLIATTLGQYGAKPTVEDYDTSSWEMTNDRLNQVFEGREVIVRTEQVRRPPLPPRPRDTSKLEKHRLENSEEVIWAHRAQLLHQLSRGFAAGLADNIERGSAEITQRGHTVSIRFGIDHDRIIPNFPEGYEGPYAIRRVYEGGKLSRPSPYSSWYTTGRADGCPTRFTSIKSAAKRAKSVCQGVWQPGGDSYVEIIPWREDNNYPMPAHPDTKPWETDASAE